jgi:hypothetical protein
LGSTGIVAVICARLAIAQIGEAIAHIEGQIGRDLI